MVVLGPSVVSGCCCTIKTHSMRAVQYITARGMLTSLSTLSDRSTLFGWICALFGWICATNKCGYRTTACSCRDTYKKGVMLTQDASPLPTYVSQRHNEVRGSMRHNPTSPRDLWFHDLALSETESTAPRCEQNLTSSNRACTVPPLTI